MPESLLFGLRVVMAGVVVVVDVTIESELRRVGARTIATCQTTPECVEICQSHHPDIVILGVTPTNLDESLEAAEQYSTGCAGLLVAIVHHLDIEDEHRLRDAGVRAIFKKPFTSSDLIPALEETLRQHARRPQ